MISLVAYQTSRKQVFTSLSPLDVLFEDMPMIRYEELESKWEHIYNGIISPFATKYQVYIKSEMRSRS